MKLNINVTIELDKSQINTLVELAKNSGFSFDGTNKPRELIKRYLVGKVESAIAYCHEHLDKD